MFPTLVRIGPIGLHSYGLMLALAFMLGIWLMQRKAAGMGVAREHVADLGLWILAAAVAGSRLFYVATHWAEFSARPLSVLAVWDGGLTFYGGVLAALPASWLYVRAKRLPYWRLSDAAAPSFALGVGLGRLGCFLSGCCFGTPSNLPWAVRFPEHSFAGQVYDCPLHPAQLYESAFGFACFGLLTLLSRSKRFPGFLMCLFLGLYGAWRLLADTWRHYETTQVWLLGLTNNQWVSILMVAGAAALGVYLRKRHLAGKKEA